MHPSSHMLPRISPHSHLILESAYRWLGARRQIWQADDGEAAPLSLRKGHQDEKLPLHATEAMAPGALHQLKAAAVSTHADTSSSSMLGMISGCHAYGASACTGCDSNCPTISWVC